MRESRSKYIQHTDEKAHYCARAGLLLKDEAQEDFQARRIRLLLAASDAGHGAATYELALSYAMGIDVSEDGSRGAFLFKKAADQGYAKAKVSHSVDLFFGLNGVKRDEETALELVGQAVVDRVENAEIALNIFMEYQRICQTVEDYL
ncbi:MAG: hypothetical protein LBD67_07175 [Candidatus Accumulibacter sp.]|jgi:TPR repeat protein|nr:hypothetical protein [Accumulibacter sp.]